MTRLFTVGEILAATGGRGEALTAEGVCSISIDSREIGPDALFVAIKGERFDGHDFVAKAVSNGAVAALVSQEKAADLGEQLIVVPDALEGLTNLARAARERSRAQIVAVTGSVGKTTTKEAIRTIFEAAGATHASIKSFNNHWGVPLMLARMPAATQFGVFEIGMSAAGEIMSLTQLVRPHIAVITTIAPAHLEAFGSLEGIAAAKAEIFAGLEPGGTALINVDHPQAAQLVDAARTARASVVTYGFAGGTDWHIASWEPLGEDRSVAQVVHEDRSYGLILNAPGRHMVANAVAALAVATLAGVEPAVSLKALAGFGTQQGRGQKTLLGNPDKPLVLVDESYNANNASMVAAMEVFARQKAPGGRKVLVLGDMLELGPQSDALHVALKDAVLATGADAVFLVGDSMGALAAALGPERVAGHAHSVADIGDTILLSLAYGDAVMVKGSNGMRLGGLVQKIRDRFA